VTEQIPILVPVDIQQSLQRGAWQVPRGCEGFVLFLNGRATDFRPVKRFDRSSGKSKRLEAIGKLVTLAATGKRIDYEIQQSLSDLIAEVYGKNLTDAIGEQALQKPKEWSRRWLPAIFNNEIRSARLVLWWPPHSSAFGPAIYCESPHTAFLVSLLLHRIRVCRGCPIIFTPKEPKQFYHDHKCAARHRQKRQRAMKGKHRKEIQKPKGELSRGKN
jgi:hypothetical protein